MGAEEGIEADGADGETAAGVDKSEEDDSSSQVHCGDVAPEWQNEWREKYGAVQEDKLLKISLHCNFFSCVSGRRSVSPPVRPSVTRYFNSIR